ncbi:hypothetical protein C9374_000553 [Naegleria lovaniensis]|uniref:F-box domain-containing protein n=1 Tax=Naegleria lovaniensis TaxID=51637 RepID=A0AA88KNT9_NAELO|nr:uncharacterized protein C9374_000553 [Naegleria lovaniensis]KAG2388389.1 hypothetical protein C9374_000553 [Naegleria lovaniensis]
MKKLKSLFSRVRIRPITYADDSDPNHSTELAKPVLLPLACNDFIPFLMAFSLPESARNSYMVLTNPDILYMIFQYISETEFIHGTCKRVCQAWYQCARKVPVSISWWRYDYQRMKDFLFIGSSSKKYYNIFQGMALQSLKCAFGTIVTTKQIESFMNLLLASDSLKSDQQANVETPTHYRHQLSHFTFSSNELDPQGVKILFNSYLASLYTNQFTISTHHIWSNLKELDISYNKIGTSGVKALVESSGLALVFSQLLLLNLSSNRIEYEGVRILMKEGFGRHSSSYLLKTLKMEGNSIGKEGAKEIAQNPNMNNLTRLDLSFTNIGDEGVHYLTSDGTFLQNLTYLNIHNSAMTVDGAKYLSTSEHVRNLKTLILSANRLGEEGVKYMSQSGTRLQSLTHLEMNYCQIGDEGLECLMNGHCIQNVTELTLRGNNLTPLGMKHIASAKIRGVSAKTLGFSNFRYLDVSENDDICDEGVKELTLASNEKLFKLQELNLFRTNISDASIEAIMKCPYWKNTLKWVGVSKNPNVTDAGRKLLEQIKSSN